MLCLSAGADRARLLAREYSYREFWSSPILCAVALNYDDCTCVASRVWQHNRQYTVFKEIIMASSNQNNESSSKQSDNKSSSQQSDTSKRGFASMDPEQQREIAAEGGRAAHEKGTAHEFTSEEARRAGSMSHKNDGRSSQSTSGGSSQSGSGGSRSSSDDDTGRSNKGGSGSGSTGGSSGGSSGGRSGSKT